MYISKIINAIANNPFRFGRILGANGDQAVARLADLNSVIDKINRQSPYRAVVVSISTDNNSVKMMRIVNGGPDDTKCVACSPCGPGEDCGSVECEEACQFVGGASMVITNITMVALGIYDVTLNNAMPFVNNPRTFGVYPAALPSKDDQIEVGPLVGNVFQIRTYRAGAPSGLILRNHAFRLEFYVYNMKDLKCAVC